MRELNGVLMCPVLILPEDCLRTKEKHTISYKEKSQKNLLEILIFRALIAYFHIIE